MRQRLGLAQALLGSPRALLLDEPTTGLDPALRQSFYEIIRDLCRDGAMALLSSHALAELEGQVDRVVVMNQGRKVADGGIADLRGSRRHPAAHSAAPAVRAARGGEWARRLGRMDTDLRGQLELSCEESDVASVLRGLPGAAQDIEIIRPSLDELYAAFQKGAP